MAVLARLSWKFDHIPELVSLSFVPHFEVITRKIAKRRWIQSHSGGGSPSILSEVRDPKTVQIPF